MCAAMRSCYSKTVTASSLVGPKWVLMQTGPRDAAVTMMHLSDLGLEEVKGKRHIIYSQYWAEFTAL